MGERGKGAIESILIKGIIREKKIGRQTISDFFWEKGSQRVNTDNRNYFIFSFSSFQFLEVFESQEEAWQPVEAWFLAAAVQEDLSPSPR